MAETPTYYRFPHLTKSDYDQAFRNARAWAEEHPEESTEVTARIFHVIEDSLSRAIRRSEGNQRNEKGLFNTHGGNNKILDKGMEGAIRQYYYEQWEMGLGASYNMVYASICHLRQVRGIPLLKVIY